MENEYNVEGFSLFHIRNRNELRVINMIKEVLPAFPEFDRCRICFEDVYALALSRVPAQYAQVGSIIIKNEITDDTIRDSVYEAFKAIIENPGHSSN